MRVAMPNWYEMASVKQTAILNSKLRRIHHLVAESSVRPHSSPSVIRTVETASCSRLISMISPGDFRRALTGESRK